MFEIHTTSQEETMELGKNLGEKVFANSCVILEGDLGAGKTTLTKGIALGLGIDRVIKSPTYTLIREFRQGPQNHPARMRCAENTVKGDFRYFIWICIVLKKVAAQVK